ncbi:hypothetical protein HDU98_005706 [Podochytrium sp. JEL0797]|nr:hypothetical protein HDU98_005706 [Podochytrium sp. JEL0797]
MQGYISIHRNVHVCGPDRFQHRSVDAISPEETVQNLISICRVLRNLGKDVYLCTIPNYGDKKTLPEKAAEGNLTRNEGILEFLKDNKEGVIAGPRLDVETYEFKNASFYYSDGIHLNNKGYLKLAKDFIDQMVPSLVKHEFDSMKKILGY